MKSHAFVVYDEGDRVIDIYVNEIWAHKKAETSNNYRVETYVRENDRKAIEIAEFMSRPQRDGWKIY